MRDNSVKSNTIAWLRFFCICAVVLLHAAWGPLKIVSFRNGAYDAVRILFSEGLCRVAVPLFFLFSGYLFFVRLEEWRTDIWVDKLKKRTKTLLVPYISWNLISILCSLVLLYLKYLLHGGDVPDLAAWFQRIGGLRAFWATGTAGMPNNYPLWFIRDLMVFVLLAPIIYQYVKRTKLLGLIVLYLVYLLVYRIQIPGLSAEGLFYFTLGGYFAVSGIDFTALFRQRRLVVSTTIVACMLVITMFLTYGTYSDLWGYAHRVFTLFGTASATGIVALLFEKQRLTIRPSLSNSSFFVYAAHGTIVLPLMQSLFGRILPFNQFGLVTGYFAAALFSIVLLVICYHWLSKWTPKTMSVLTGGRIE